MKASYSVLAVTTLLALTTIIPSTAFAKTETVSTGTVVPVHPDGTAPGAAKTNAATGNTTFPQGMVTLTFDDGWESQYQNAYPILQSAHVPGSFYIITNQMLNANPTPNGNILCNDPNIDTCDGAEITTSPASWIAAGQYPDPSEATYTFRQTYTANAQVSLVVTYYNQNGNPISRQQNISLGKFAAGTGVNQTVTFTIPKVAFSKPNMSFTLKETVPAGKTLSVTNPTLAVSSGLDTYMNTAQVQSLGGAGNEIAPHTTDHCDLVMLQNDPTSATKGGDAGPPAGACAYQLGSPSTASQQINGSLSALLANGFSAIDTFVYPYGSYDVTTEGILKSAGFIGARTTIPGYNTKATDPYGLFTQNVDLAATNKGITQVQNWINNAKTNKKWLILMFHNVEPMTALKANGDVDGTTPEFLQSIVTYLKANNVCVVTMHKAMTAMGTSTVNPCL